MCIYVETSKRLKGIRPVKVKQVRKGNISEQLFVYAVHDWNYSDIIKKNGNFECRAGLNLVGARS